MSQSFHVPPDRDYFFWPFCKPPIPQKYKNIYYRSTKNRGNTEYRPGKNFTVYCLLRFILHNFIPIVNDIT